VDDDKLIVGVTVMMLEGTGVRITEAADGEQALVLVRSRAFDCVIMDCNMPIMDGIQCTRLIRAHEAEQARTRNSTRHTPIIGHSANAQTQYEKACIAAGMEVLVPKPCNKRTLLMHIARFSGRGGECGTSGGSPESAHAAATAITSTPSATSTDPDDGGDTAAALPADTTAALPAQGAKDDGTDDCPLDLENGATIWGDMDLYLVMIKSFKESLPEALSSIEEAYQARDLERLSRECHTLKGSAGYAQAVQLVEATDALQDHGMSGIDKVYKQFAEEACRVRTYLDGDTLLGVSTDSIGAGD
jgi:CheY-like chemotaxis protein